MKCKSDLLIACGTFMLLGCGEASIAGNADTGFEGTGHPDIDADSDSDSYSNNDSDTVIDLNSDTYSNNDSDSDTAGNTVFIRNWPDYEYQELLECPPDNLSFEAYKIFESASYESKAVELSRFIWNIGMQRLDDSQIVDCEVASADDECREANYTDTDGAVIAYRDITENLEHQVPMYGPMYETRGTETLSITLPSGLDTWTSLKLEYHGESTIGGMERTSSHTTSAEWTGSIMDRWPENGELSFGSSYRQYDMGGNASSYVANSNCSVSYDGSIVITVAGKEIAVHQVLGPDSNIIGHNGYINDICIGEVDYNTWEVLGDCI